MAIDLTAYGHGDWTLPPRDLLKRSTAKAVDERVVEQGGEVLQATLRDFGVDAKLIGMTVGPTVTRYELELAPGVKVNRVTGLSHDIAYAMASPDVRILAPIPGRSAIGVEVPNKQRQLVTLGDILTSPEAAQATHPLEVGLGRDIAGRSHMLNLATMPHLLIAGQTGAGQVELHQQPDHVDPDALHARAGAHDPRRPQAGGARPVQRPAAPAHRGGHEPEEGRQRARVGGARDGPALRPALRGRRARHHRLQRDVRPRRAADGREPGSGRRPQLRAPAVHRHRRRRAQRPDDGRGARRRAEHLPDRADGPCGRHPPRDRDAAPVGRRHHRRHQGQRAEPARVLGEHARRLARRSSTSPAPRS